MDELVIEWDRTTRKEWHGLLTGAPRCGLQQGWAYGAALAASNVGVRRLVVRGRRDRVIACAQLAERRLLGLVRTGFLLRGPVWLDPETGRMSDLLKTIHRQLGSSALIWAPEAAVPPAGHRAVITGYSTGWLDLERPAAARRRQLAGKWRHSLGQAERAGLEVRRERVGPALGWLLAGNEAHRRTIGYRGPGPGFLRGLAQAAEAGGDLLLLTARQDGALVAGVMMIRHGSSATYEVGHVTAQGRRAMAKFLLLWQAQERLAELGVRWLDLGGLDTVRAPGVARFKLGLHPEIETLAGTFLSLQLNNSL